MRPPEDRTSEIVHKLFPSSIIPYEQYGGLPRAAARGFPRVVAVSASSKRPRPGCICDMRRSFVLRDKGSRP